MLVLVAFAVLAITEVALLSGFSLASALAAAALAVGGFVVYETGHRESVVQLLRLGFLFGTAHYLLPQMVDASPQLAPAAGLANAALGLAAACSLLHSVLVLSEARRAKR